MLARGREIAPYPTEGARAVRRSETAADLLLQFDHPQISFRAIIIERHSKVGHKAQNGVTMLL